MILVGITGRIGAGKSTVAARLAERGAELVDADRIAHDVLETEQVRHAIAERFGDAVIDDLGRVRRRRLAEQVFGPDDIHAAALADLEAIVHPEVRRRIEARLAGIAADETTTTADGRASQPCPQPGRVVVLDVPLLVQSGWAARCDRGVEVICDEAVRQQRLTARGWSADAIRWRDAAWDRGMPQTGLSAVLPAEKCRRVDASGGIAYTHAQVDRIWVWLGTTPC
jgi:dephospho-CoA kinase